jgi:hypothetical protein
VPPGGANPPGSHLPPPSKDCKPVYKHLRFESCGYTDADQGQCALKPGQQGFVFELELPRRDRVRSLVSAWLSFGGHELVPIAGPGDELCLLQPHDAQSCAPASGLDPRQINLLELSTSAATWLDWLYAHPRMLIGAPACWNADRAELDLVLEMEDPSCCK